LLGLRLMALTHGLAARLYGHTPLRITKFRVWVFPI
jgi:hypothetical protein